MANLFVMKNELQNYMGRPKRYNNIDGTGEIGMGLMAVCYGLLGYVQAVLPENSMWSHGLASMLLFFAGLLLMAGLLLWVPKAIKKRITWPRTGYVTYRRWGKSWWTVMIASVVITAVIAAGVDCLIRFDRSHDWMSLPRIGAVAIYVAGYGYWIYRMERDHPWKWLVLLLMVLGLLVVALIAPADLVGLWAVMLLLVGLAWLGSGGVTLYLYIRHTRPPAPEAE
jgi:drug/metabolite transporter (DMT)-like permease